MTSMMYSSGFDRPKDPAMPNATFDKEKCQKYVFITVLVVASAALIAVITYLAWDSVNSHF